MINNGIRKKIKKERRERERSKEDRKGE